MGRGEQRGRRGRRVSPLEIVVSAIGLGLTLAMLSFIAWEAFGRNEDLLPVVTVSAREVTEEDGIWVLGFRALNHSPATASNVEITGRLLRDGREVAASRVLLDHVPGKSTVRGGMFFDRDPRLHEVELRALGYADP